MTEDSLIVREVRERALQLEERFGHDLHQYCEYLRRQEKKHSDRVVDQIAVVQSKALCGPAK